MIIFDPKGELYNITGGFRNKFSKVLKFSPISKETVCFNPLEEIELTEEAFADIGLILANIFEEPKGGNDGASQFFDNAAKDLLTALIFHIISSGLYPKEKQNMGGVLSVLSEASACKVDKNGNVCAAGDVLLDEMIESPHFDRNGVHQEYIDRIIRDAASRSKSQHEKVRSDTFSTVFTKMNLFADPYLEYVTNHSDFKLNDFYDSEEPISLYLTVPFSHIDRIAPVFKLLINFILRKFSADEMRIGQKEKKLKNRIMFLLDEFPVLGSIPFLSKCMGILAGFGINFYIIVQALNQIVDIYGQNHTFLDNCKTVVVFAPGKPEDAKAFCEILGKKSVVKQNMSASGNRYGLSLDNLNESAQDIAVEMMNPDEMMHMSPQYALIINQGSYAYLAVKNVYYMDERLKYRAFNVDSEGNCISGWPAPYSIEEIQSICRSLPSNQKSVKKTSEVVKEALEKYKKEKPAIPNGTLKDNDIPFSAEAYFETLENEDELFIESVSPEDKDIPPTIKNFDHHDFEKKDN